MFFQSQSYGFQALTSVFDVRSLSDVEKILEKRQQSASEFT